MTAEMICVVTPYQVVDVSILDAAEHGPIRMAGGIDPVDAAEELLLQQRFVSEDTQ